MNEITSTQYWDQISSIATELVSESMEQSDNDRDDAEEIINDRLLHETIDGHEWIIYYYYNQFVLQFTGNREAYEDFYSAEDIGNLVMEKGVDALNTTMAFFAMHSDVQDRLSDTLDAFEEELAA